MKKLLISIVLVFSIAPTISSSEENQLTKDGDYRIKSRLHLINEIRYKNEHFRAVVEVPAGSISKWEVNKNSGHLEWEFKKGKPRKINYLGYPGNYGFIPQTSGVDGDALDVIVLGESKSRGAIQEIKIIGALKLRDKGVDDHKILAVPLEKPFKKIDSIGEMVRKYPGVIHIVRLWFEGYKKAGKIQFLGYMKQSESVKLIEDSHNKWLGKNE